MSILFHEIIEKLLDNSSSAINSTINSQILSSVNENQQKMRDLTSSICNIEARINQMNYDITNSMIVKMLDIKKEYIDEVKSLMSIENTEHYDIYLQGINTMFSPSYDKIQKWISDNIVF